ncbi:hypothetical protein ACT7C1_32675 [Bacillus paranthracis]
MEDKQRKFKLTELGNAERIAYEYGHVIKFIHNRLVYGMENDGEWIRRRIETITAKSSSQSF